MKRPRTVARAEGSLGLLVRCGLILFLAWAASETILRHFAMGDRSGQGVTDFIWLGFSVGLAVAFSELVLLLWRRRQFAWLRKEINGEDLRAFVAARASSRNPFVVTLAKLVEQFDRNPAAVDAPTLLGLLHRRFSRNAQRLLRMVVLLLALGLVGTCVGLMGMLSSLTETVAMSDGQGGPEFMRELLAYGGPLAGLGSAYSSTLIGLACGSIVLRFLGHALQDGVEALVDQFDEWVSVYVLPELGA